MCVCVYIYMALVPLSATVLQFSKLLLILYVVFTAHDVLLNLCDNDRPQLQVQNISVGHSLCSFSDIPVLGRSVA